MVESTVKVVSVTPTPKILVFLLTINSFSIESFEKKILLYFFLSKTTSCLLATTPFAVGLSTEPCSKVVSWSLDASPLIVSKITISERDQSAYDAKIVLSMVLKLQQIFQIKR